MSLEGTLAIILIVFVIVACLCIAIGNLIRRRKEFNSLSNSLESYQETIKTQKYQKSPVESCLISAEEIREAVDACINPLKELEGVKGYTGDKNWAKVFGIQTELNFSLKDLTLLSMKAVEPRSVIDFVAEILETNIPIDALDMIQNQRSFILPQYKMAAGIIWAQIQENLSKQILLLKEIYGNRQGLSWLLLAELTILIMKELHIPMTASGLAVIIALIIAKTEFIANTES